MSGDVVVARDLTVAYPGRHRFDAVRGIDLRIGAGELVGVVGETGAGKSSLAKAVALAAGPRVAGGSLEVLGHRAARPGRRGRSRLGLEVGFLPQHASRTLLPNLTVEENVAAPVLRHDRHAPNVGARVAELIDAVQLPLGILGRFPWELSGGQRQRVAVARSLILGPKLWVADEPTLGVDVATRGPVLETLLDLHRERVFSALVVSHDAAVMHRTTHRVVVMQRGLVIASGTAAEVLAEPRHPYVRGLRDDHAVRTGAITLPVR